MNLYNYACAEISKSAIRNNLKTIRKIINNRLILVPVKCDAYGHGLVKVSKIMEKSGVDYLGVAFIEEGIKIRKSGVRTPILVFNRTMVEDYSLAAKNGLTLTILDDYDIKMVSKIPAGKRKSIKFHLNVDTGMNRLGISHIKAKELLKRIKNLNIELEGIYTHLSCADSRKKDDMEFTKYQIRKFGKIVRASKKILPGTKIFHCANSSAILNYPDSYFNMVRPGIIIYGYSADNNIIKKYNILPSMYLKSRVTFTKKAGRGISVSYGRSYKAEKKMKIATIAIGYGDGYSRLLSNKGCTIVCGEYAPVIGRVCMDQIIIDITGIKGVRIGSEVTLFGKSDKKEIRVESLSRLAKTIPYEIVTSIGQRVKRIYVF